MQPLSDITNQARNRPFRLRSSKRGSQSTQKEREHSPSAVDMAESRPRYMSPTIASEAQSSKSKGSTLSGDFSLGRRSRWVKNAMKRVTPRSRKSRQISLGHEDTPSRHSKSAIGRGAEKLTVGVGSRCKEIATQLKILQADSGRIDNSPTPPMPGLPRTVSNQNQIENFKAGTSPQPPSHCDKNKPSPTDKPLPSIPVLAVQSNDPIVRRSLIDATEQPLRRHSGLSSQDQDEEWPIISPKKHQSKQKEISSSAGFAAFNSDASIIYRSEDQNHSEDPQFGPNKASSTSNEVQTLRKEPQIGRSLRRVGREQKLKDFDVSLPSSSASTEDMSPGAAAMENFLHEQIVGEKCQPKQMRMPSLRARLSATAMQSHQIDHPNLLTDVPRSKLPVTRLPVPRYAHEDRPMNHSITTKGSPRFSGTRSSVKSADNRPSSKDSNLSHGSHTTRRPPSIQTGDRHTRIANRTPTPDVLVTKRPHQTPKSVMARHSCTYSTSTKKRSSLPLPTHAVRHHTTTKTNNLEDLAMRSSKPLHGGKENNYYPDDSLNVFEDKENVMRNQSSPGSIMVDDTSLPLEINLSITPPTSPEGPPRNISSNESDEGRQDETSSAMYRVKDLSATEYGPQLKISDAAEKIIVGTGPESDHPSSNARSVPDLRRSAIFRRSSDFLIVKGSRLSRSLTGNSLNRYRSENSSTNDAPRLSDPDQRSIEMKSGGETEHMQEGPDDPFIESLSEQHPALTRYQTQSTASGSEETAPWVSPVHQGASQRIVPMLSPVVEISPKGETPITPSGSSEAPIRAPYRMSQASILTENYPASIKSRRIREMLKKGKEIINQSSTPRRQPLNRTFTRLSQGQHQHRRQTSLWGSQSPPSPPSPTGPKLGLETSPTAQAAVHILPEARRFRQQLIEASNIHRDTSVRHQLQSVSSLLCVLYLWFLLTPGSTPMN